ncbi:MAG: Gfo/Idh/MocA family oxidoreductase [Deltaproteobacteria bacterium]|nr:MAG: Gfo/Idh/MocA family oxidoreductase [Deltaproteobacteria bacterium]
MGRSRVNVAIVGVGYWGGNLLRTFSKLPEVRVTDVCDLDATRLRALGAEHPELRLIDDLGELVGRDDVDAVVIATPPSRHHTMALAALHAGKHVWVEKPLALSAAEGLKRLIDEGALGELYHLSFERLGMGRIRRDSNVWWNSAPHDLSILFHLVPRPVVSTRLHQHTYLQPGIADMAVCDLELEGGISAHIYLSWLHPEKTARVTVVGSERMLTYEGRFEKRGITLYDYAVDPSTTNGRGAAAPILPVSHFFARRLEIPAAAEPLGLAAAHFVDCVVTGREPLTSGARSLRVVEVLEAAEHGATQGGRAG